MSFISQAAEAAAVEAKLKAAMSEVKTAAREEAVAVLTKQVRELEAALGRSGDAEEVEALQRALAHARTQVDEASTTRLQVRFRRHRFPLPAS
jgi:hypothetical protein